jgi:hypothetical protein
MGTPPNAGFADPDGDDHEVVWVKPGLTVETRLR